MRIISIDPAPAKQSTVYDGRFDCPSPAKLVATVQELAKSDDCLVCWDAPLTGPRSPRSGGYADKDFSQRVIESFFSRASGMKTPAGISVLGYAGCPHWAITRAALGLPRVGRYDADTGLPLLHISSGPAPMQPGAYVVEIHPAVALWLWLDEMRPGEEWRYKDKNFETCRDALCLCPAARLDDPEIWKQAENDDQLDALIGFVLGSKWLKGDGSVVLLGSQETGSFLVPNVRNIEERFADFTARVAKERGW